MAIPDITPDLAFNTAISFVVNCNLQHYSGEIRCYLFNTIICNYFFTICKCSYRYSLFDCVV